MVCLGLEPGVAGWKAQTNPLSYSGTPMYCFYTCALTYERVHVRDLVFDMQNTHCPEYSMVCVPT